MIHIISTKPTEDDRRSFRSTEDGRLPYQQHQAIASGNTMAVIPAMQAGMIVQAVQSLSVLFIGIGICVRWSLWMLYRILRSRVSPHISRMVSKAYRQFLSIASIRRIGTVVPAENTERWSSFNVVG